MEFLGFEFRRKTPAVKQDLDEFIPKVNDDGAVVGSKNYATSIPVR